MTAPEKLAEPVTVMSVREQSNRSIAAGLRFQADVLDIAREHAAEDYFRRDPAAWLQRFADDLRMQADKYAPEAS